MFKFNNSNIFTGYLKQLLHDFKLPKYHIYSKENRDYFEKYGVEKNIIESEPDLIPGDKKYPTHVRNVLYLKDDSFQKYVNKKWETVNLGKEFKKKSNNYTNLIIKNQIYDSYTHEYLGNYLRYLRDLHNINLMPLYNCFSYNTGENISINITKNSKKVLTFNSSDTNYKLYILPVKYFKEYTIAIDCDKTIEMCCFLYNKYQDTRTQFDALYDKTYYKISNTSFNRPFIYDKLVDLDDFLDKGSFTELGQNEDKLKLIIKLPADNNSSITILEGNYLNWNDGQISQSGARITGTTYNHAVINLGASNDKLEALTLKPITSLQLLKMNTGESYPFADRLIEYLADNTITDLDSINGNVLRAQTVIKENGNNISVNGAWDNKMQLIFYDYMYQDKSRNNINDDSVFHDLLGFVDKDVEKYYKSRNSEKEEKNSLMNIDIYPDLYLSDKRK